MSSKNEFDHESVLTLTNKDQPFKSLSYNSVVFWPECSRCCPFMGVYAGRFKKSLPVEGKDGNCKDKDGNCKDKDGNCKNDSFVHCCENKENIESYFNDFCGLWCISERRDVNTPSTGETVSEISIKVMKIFECQAVYCNRPLVIGLIFNVLSKELGELTDRGDSGWSHRYNEDNLIEHIVTICTEYEKVV